MPWESIDWQALERLRRAFLDGSAGARDYWQSRRDLDSYDQTFAQRIGWKWDHVLGELRRVGWTPPAGELVDWGCGSGVASRAFLDFFGRHSVSALVLHDRSALARQYAADRAREKYRGLTVSMDAAKSPAVLLLSHVLTELNEPQLTALLGFAGQATAILWVEPGTHEASRRLIAARERLRTQFHVVAPCCHQGPCGLLAPGNERHWCHHFAASPPGIFSDPEWARFGLLAGVDLRSLPVSYLVLDRRPVAALPAGSFRVLGRPRVSKPHVRILGCDGDGARECTLARRDLPEAYRALKKGEHPSLLRWRCEGEVIRELLLPPPALRPEAGE